MHSALTRLCREQLLYFKYFRRSRRYIFRCNLTSGGVLRARGCTISSTRSADGFGQLGYTAGDPKSVTRTPRSGDITSHYPAPEIEELLEATNRVCEGGPRNSRTHNPEKKNDLEIAVSKPFVLAHIFGSGGRI